MGLAWGMQERCKLSKLHKFVLWEAEEWTTESWSLREMGMAGWDHPHLTGMTSYKNPIQQPAKNPADEAVATTSRCLEVEPASVAARHPRSAGWASLCISSGVYWDDIQTRTFFLIGGSSVQIKKWVSIKTHSGIAFIKHFDFYPSVLLRFLRKVTTDRKTQKQILC